jgi:SAM-dependent methyltransferase
MPKYTARTADKHMLYQIAVQSPEAEVDFIERVYRQTYGKAPTLFREDFCGTALISCAWASVRRANHAYGVDLHKPTLDWGLEHNVRRLPTEAASRVHLLNKNVLHVARPRVHAVGAFNFSYFIWKDFPQLVRYFRGVRRALLPEGLFVLDAYGGWEAQEVMEEETKLRGFTYVWHQAEYNPVNDHTVCHIHFKFPDGSVMRKAFTYDWRLWTLGAIRDALVQAGFASTDVHWEGTTRQGEGNGVYRRTCKAENLPGWNAYITALPG